MVVRLVRAFRRFRADAVLVYGAKPVIYGSIAARIVGVRLRTAMITGVGSALAGGSGLRRRALAPLLRRLYRIALRGTHIVFFQNPDDEQLFRSLGLIGDSQRVVRINGSGVDLVHFARCADAAAPPVTFLHDRPPDPGQGRPRVRRGRPARSAAAPGRTVRAARTARFEPVGHLGSRARRMVAEEVRSTTWAARRTSAHFSPALTSVCFRPTARACRGPFSRRCRWAERSSPPTRPAAARPWRRGETACSCPCATLSRLPRRCCRCSPRRNGSSRWDERSRAIAEERFDVHAVNRTILGAMGLD